jgi:hypothetical protein
MANDGFELARGLMQLSSLVEQRRARKEEMRFREAYEGPLKEAYTNYYNAMIDKMQDEELLSLEKRTKGAQASRFEAEAGMSQATFDEIKALRTGSPEEKTVARNFLLKINENQAFRDQLAQIRVQNEQLQTMISSQQFQLGMDKFQLQQTEGILSLILSPEGRTFLEGVLGEKGLEAVKKDTAEEFTGRKAPEKKKPKPLPLAPFKGAPAGMTFPFAPKKTKPAAEKKVPEKKPSETALEEIDMMSVIGEAFKMAEENNVDRAEVVEGAKRITKAFPDLDAATKRDVYRLLAEGIPAEEIEAHIREKRNE